MGGGAAFKPGLGRGRTGKVARDIARALSGDETSGYVREVEAHTTEHTKTSSLLTVRDAAGRAYKVVVIRDDA